MEYAVERFGNNHRSIGIRTWRRAYGTVAWREIELHLWSRILYVSIKENTRNA
jgi:hypothetical protein